MTPEQGHEALIADLRALGRSVPATGTLEPELTSAVLARLAKLPPPRPESGLQRLWRRAGEALARRRRQVLIATAILLLGCLGVPGVRAAVVEWFSFAGVQIRIQPDPVPPRPQAPPSPPAVNLSLEKARTMVEFAPLVPAALGLPERVEVRGDRHSLALTWTRADGGSTRLEQFDGRLDYSFAKTAQGVEWTQVNDASALWFEQPHELVLMDAAGNRRTETARTAGRTLIWEQDGTVLRLESDLSLEQAVAIAGTAR